MGFWDVTKRVFQGKPGFEPPKPGSDWDDDAPTIDYAEERAAKMTGTTAKPTANDSTSLFDPASGHKQIPTVCLTSPKSIQSGSKVDLWITIENQSSRPVYLDKVAIFNTIYQVDIPLEPGRDRQLRVYRGPQMTHDNYHKASLYYKDEQSGDYFRADHMIDYKYDGDKTYDVTGFDLLTPIVDI